MIIALEGPDGAGKTTLGRQLKEQANLRLYHVQNLHAGPPTPGTNALDEYELGLRRWRATALDPDQLLILDRWHLGELIYGPLLRGASRLTPPQFEHVERYLDALGAVRVIVHADEATLTARYHERGDDLVSLEQVHVAARGFYAEGLNHHWRQVVSPTSHAARLDLLIWAHVECHRVQPLRPFPTYVGPPTPGLLLVGDVPSGWVPDGDVPPAREPNPALLPYRVGNSAHFLLEALHGDGCAAGVHPAYGLANANDGTDVHALYHALERPRVVALGERAHVALTQREVPHERVPHPQWVRRFKHRELATYGHQLAHAIAA